MSIKIFSVKIKKQLKPAVQIIIVIFAAVILSSYFFRIDLTSEKRYTLSAYSKRVLKKLNDVVFIRVYLEGDLNIPFLKMQRSIREMLDEFRVYGKDNLQYVFINPFESNDAQIRKDMFNELYEKGLKPVNILSNDKEGGSSEKIIFPGALITYRGIEIPVNLLQNNPQLSAEENINNSLQSLEFELIKIISSRSKDNTEKIAFIEGHGELDEYQTEDISKEIAWFYQVDRGRIQGKPGILDDYKAVIIAKPALRFSEQDKFVLDQYLMKGGRILWFLDRVDVSTDSLTMGSTMAMINDLNLDDMLFRYGVRINPVLIKDLQCNIIPVNVALAGNTPDFRPSPWYYFPLLSSPPEHPVTRNLNMIKSEFVNTIDTIGARKGSKKTVLLKSSIYSTFSVVPALISLDEIRIKPNPEEFKSSGMPVAVILEGTFESVFRNRMVDDIISGAAKDFIETSNATKMLVVADGDIIRNDVRITPQGIYGLPLGFDRYTQQTYGNKDFIMNALHYLTGNEELIKLRSREITLRLLNKVKVKKEKIFWVLANTVLPGIIVIIAGLIYNILRRRKYMSI
jgi:gliding-associated putative ABC transporter substrate-binding component GldG